MPHAFDVRRSEFPRLASKFNSVRLKPPSPTYLSLEVFRKLNCASRDFLNAKGYNIVRRDRASGGGGLMFLIRDVHFQRLPDIGNETSDLEYLGITVHSKDRTITIKNLYHPPNSQHLDTNMTEGLFDDYTII
ncbi:hypothetical protein TNCV_3446371 [Trichonephila clavipes]|nr:hypothetical protein TNCV_3446371 [Trichonephila clavipes]